MNIDILRNRILEYHYQVWKKNASSSAYLGVNEVVRELVKMNSDADFSQCKGAIESLIEDGYLKVVEVQNPQGVKELLSRVISSGRNYLKKRRNIRIGWILSAASVVATIGVYFVSQ
ncbi:hypothetical protein [Halomonas salifodinae]|uniref:hypothetical protein n=1 Tax=Halomonas salifodinae TaxID=438745 RepID=UPI0033AEB5EE